MLLLSDCKLCDDEAVASFLKVDETLEEVYLRYNNIGPRGMKAIADAVKHNNTVWYLGLDGNQIRDEGADELIDALTQNVCIIELCACYNEIAPESMVAIKYLTETRNAILIPAAVCRASLYLIFARRVTADAGMFSIFPKEIVRMIAMAVWATRKDPKWIEAVK